MTSGGRRPGAGRKADPENKRVSKTFRLMPETVRRIERLRQRGVKFSREIDKLAEALENAEN